MQMAIKSSILVENNCKVYDSLSEERKEETKSDFGDIRLRVYVCFVIAINLLYGICYSELAPFFPEEAEKKNVAPSAIGWIVGIYGFIRIFATPIIGLFMTCIRVEYVYNSGLLVTGVAMTLFGVLIRSLDGWIFIFICMVCRAFAGIGLAASLTARGIIVAIAFPNSIATVNGIMFSSFEIGTMVGPPLGGALYTYGGFMFTFVLTGTVLLAVSAISVPLTPSVKDDPKKNYKSNLKCLKNAQIYICVMTIFQSNFNISFMEPTLELHLLKLNLSPMTIGLMFLFSAVTCSVCSVICSWINDRKSWQIEMMVLGTIVSTLTFLLIGPAPFLSFIPLDFWTEAVALTFLGFGFGCSFNSGLMCMFKLVKTIGMGEDVEILGMVSVLINTAISSGLFFGPIISGTLVDYLGFEWANCFAATMNILNTVAIICMVCLNRYSSKKKGNCSNY